MTGCKVSRAQEHSGLLAMLGFIVETERRQLYLRRGYSSLFDYCVRELCYSESQAMRRITAARCIAKFPEVFELLKANDINLGTISRVSRILTPENRGSVLASIRRKSLREVEAIVAEHEPVAAFPRDRVRTIVARVPLERAMPLGEIHLRNEGKKDPALEALTKNEKPAAHAEQIVQSGATDLSGQDQPALNHGEQGGDINSPEQHGALNEQSGELSALDSSPAFAPPARFERRSRVEFTARQELMEKLERIRAIASHRIPARASMEQLIDFMADYVIHREDPVKRHQRRQTRHLKKTK